MNKENIIVEMLIRDNDLKLKDGEIEKERLILEAYDQRKTDDLPDLREDDSRYTMSLLGYHISRIREIIREINNEFDREEGKKRKRRRTRKRRKTRKRRRTRKRRKKKRKL